MKVANPSSQDRTPRRAIVLAPSPAAANYRASGLVLWRKAAGRRNVCSWGKRSIDHLIGKREQRPPDDISI